MRRSLSIIRMIGKRTDAGRSKSCRTFAIDSVILNDQRFSCGNREIIPERRSVRAYKERGNL